MAKKQNIVKKDRKKTVETKEEKLSRIKSEVNQDIYAVDSKEVAKAIIKKTKENS